MKAVATRIAQLHSELRNTHNGVLNSVEGYTPVLPETTSGARAGPPHTPG
jgi:hypothetical protein